jgi:hypothetical protein
MTLWAKVADTKCVKETVPTRPMLRSRPTRRLLATVLVTQLALAACGPSPQQPETPPAVSEWREFEGIWTAAGSRHTIRLAGDRRASIAELSGSLLLAGASRPAVGFRADVITFNDSATGMVGRSVWTDERGAQVYSELLGQGTERGDRVVGTILGGTGRYAGATGTYEFSWQFVLETEDGTVQGQSIGLKGRVHIGSPQATPETGGQQQ